MNGNWVYPAIGLSGVVALVTFVFRNNYKNDNKVSRVYRRLDEVKTFNDATFVRQSVCDVLSKQLRDDIIEIKQDVKTLLRHSNGDKKARV